MDSKKIGEKKESKSIYGKDINLIMVNDLLICGDLFILDVVNTHKSKMDPEVHGYITRGLTDIFDNKDISPMIGLMMNKEGILKLRHEDEENIENQRELARLFITTKKSSRITAPIWEYIKKRYPNIEDDMIPTVANPNAFGLLNAENNIIVCNDVNPMYNEIAVIRNMYRTSNRDNIIGFRNGLMSLIINEMNPGHLPEKQMIALILFTAEFADDFGMREYIANYKGVPPDELNGILSNLIFKMKLVNDSIHAYMHERKFMALANGVNGLNEMNDLFIPHRRLSMWDPNLVNELKMENQRNVKLDDAENLF